MAGEVLREVLAGFSSGCWLHGLVYLVKTHQAVHSGNGPFFVCVSGFKKAQTVSSILA